MFSILDRNVRLCDGVNRREMLHVGGLGACGLSLPGLVNAAADPGSELANGSFGRAKRCIVLFLLGGPPQHETWDPKPDAPSEVRGDFSPIESATPGLRVGELMPRTAKLTDRIAVLRAVSTADNAHSSSGYWMLTGYPHTPMNKENALHGPPNDWPCVGAVVRHLRGDTASLPGAVRLPEEIWNTGRIVWPGQDAGWLGDSADPWLLDCDPNKPDFKIPDLSLPGDIPALRFDRRRSLLASVNQHLDAVERGRAVERWSGLQRKAFDLLSSSDARRAFDIQDEPEATRERYGRNRFGQSVLLARRLVEAGVSLVQVNWTRWEEDQAVAPAWDNHADNSKRLKTVLMPPMDLAYSALLEDLEQRGMLDDTLVVWIGEFGRTPKINARGGRDHWGHVFSAALAGGGVQGGTVHGVSDSQAAYPASGRVEPQDITATIFHCLGYRPSTELHDALGRPMLISKGAPIGEILQS
ncbi:MAG: DUF1501 domain-containing protein [Planctomycetota bacterium]|nr:DUF1501 domain-containing protein [Planctomycetota bacterium]